MPTKYKCPGCEYEIFVPNLISQKIESWTGEEIGCNNNEEHDNEEPLIMWKDNE